MTTHSQTVTQAAHGKLWLMVSGVIVLLILGYSIFLYHTPGALSSSYECKYKDGAECAHGNCTKECGKNCEHKLEENNG